MGDRCTVNVFTTDNIVDEQPIAIYAVTAVTMVGDRLLTIEAESGEVGHKFSAYHRFESHEWTHMSMHHFGGDTH